MKAKLIIYFIFWIFFIFSCTENVNVSVPTQDTTSANFALILCEGLWGYNNSSVSKLNLFTYDVINDFTFFANTNFKIGDTGNDIALKGDTFFVVVTTSKVLEIFNSKTGKLIDYITFQEGSAPRHIAIINDTLVAVTDLFKDCVYLVNIVSKNIVNTILVGPAPEFVEFYDGKLFVVNSGYGDYRAKEPKAGTLSVVDIKLGKEIQNVFIAPNPIEVLIDRLRKRLFVSYNHLPSLKDSIGGIVMFDVENLKVLNSWRIQNKGLFLDDETGEIYFTSKDKIAKINPNNGKIDVVVSNTKSTEIWYSVAYDNKKKILLIGNAKNYTVEGEVIIFEYFNSNFNFVKSVSVGLNPTEIVIKQ